MANRSASDPAHTGGFAGENLLPETTDAREPSSESVFGKTIKKIKALIRGIPAIPAVILPVFVFVGVFNTFIMPHDPNQIALQYTQTPPFWQEGGTVKFLLGTDHLGRDILSRIMGGAGISMQVGFVVVFIAGGIGAIVALVSGYVGGKVDSILMRITDMMLSLPYLLMAIVLSAVLQPSKYNIILILGIMGWSRYARVLRSEVLRIKEGDFIRLAKVNGCGNFRIMSRHILPNIINTLVILATLQLGGVIIAEAALSFIGVGIPPPHPAWGSMLAEGRNYIAQSWWMCVWPGVAILLVVLSCNLLGDWLRVRLDPKFRQM